MDVEPTTALSAFEARLKLAHYNQEIEFVQFQWVDFTGLARTRMTTFRQAELIASEGRSINVASPIVSAFLVDGSFNEVNVGAKDCLDPDWTTLKRCHYQPNHAAVLCYLDEAGRGKDCCPRSILKQIEAQAKAEHDVSFKVGAEVEFYLMDTSESIAPVKDVAAYCATASLRSRCMKVLEEAVRAIELAGIHTWTFHSELVPGLFEISTEPMAPLLIADSLVYIHEAIKTSANQNNMHATLHPKPFDDTHGVGQHMHISMSPEGNDEAFLSGVLDSVPAISAISMPSFDSYLRGDFAGAHWVTWDVENRSCSVRKIRQGYWEFRFIDSTANNYLTLATVLGAGLVGIACDRKLKMKPLEGKSSNLDDQAREELGVEKRAPKDLKEAVEFLKQDHVVRDVLGIEVWSRYIRYKAKEEDVMGSLSRQERRSKLIPLF